jgi:endonuclease-3
MLSSQTKDEVVDDAILRLRKAIGGTMSLDALLAADDATIASSINKCGFWKKKTECAAFATRQAHAEFKEAT